MKRDSSNSNDSNIIDYIPFAVPIIPVTYSFLNWKPVLAIPQCIQIPKPYAYTCQLHFTYLIPENLCENT